jgi:hypothetical protein
MSNWPSPRPGPAWHAWRTAWDHIERKTLVDVPHATAQAIRQTEAVRKAEDRAIQRAQSGDVLATRSACQAWNKTLRDALHQMREEAA